MDWLIIRHAESEYNVELTDDLNSELTPNGHMQAMLTADWLNKHFEEIEEFKTLTSPYFRTLQTSHYIHEATKARPFAIEENLREFHIDKNEKQLENGGMFITSEALLFNNFEWPDVMDMGFYFPNETLDEFFERIQEFIAGLDPDGKYLAVSHGATCRTLYTILTGGDLEKVRERYYESLPRNEAHIEESIRNCSMTLIRNGEEKWFSKIVYDPE